MAFSLPLLPDGPDGSDAPLVEGDEFSGPDAVGFAPPDEPEEALAAAFPSPGGPDGPDEALAAGCGPGGPDGPDGTLAGWFTPTGGLDEPDDPGEPDDPDDHPDEPD